MKRPKFRLQAVLELRASALEDAENVLKKAVFALASLRAKREETIAEANRVADVVCTSAARKIASQHEAGRQAYLHHIHIAGEIDQQITEAQANVNFCRKKVIEASKEHEILVRLKEKWGKELAYEEAKKEEAMLNDMSNARRFFAEKSEVSEKV